MSGKYTPGPWVAVKCGARDHGGWKPIFPEGLWDILRDSDRRFTPIATVDKADDHDEATRIKAASDARLIAAAPELLEALKRFTEEALSWHSIHHNNSTTQCDSLCECIPAAQAAIAKAVGE